MHKKTDEYIKSLNSNWEGGFNGISDSDLLAVSQGRRRNVSGEEYNPPELQANSSRQLGDIECGSHINSAGGFSSEPRFSDWVLRSGSSERVHTEHPVSRASDRQVGGEHYKDMAIEPGEFAEANGLSYMEGNAIKYICRDKESKEEDLHKAIHCLELELEWGKKHGRF
jgi:hypothetical protein